MSFETWSNIIGVAIIVSIIAQAAFYCYAKYQDAKNNYWYERFRKCNGDRSYLEMQIRILKRRATWKKSEQIEDDDSSTENSD